MEQLEPQTLREELVETGFLVVRQGIASKKIDAFLEAVVSCLRNSEIKYSKKVYHDLFPKDPETSESIQGLRDLHLDASKPAKLRESIFDLLTDEFVLEAIEECAGSQGSYVPFRSCFYPYLPLIDLRQDHLYFDTDPPGSVVGVCIPLENIEGIPSPLFFFPKSNRLIGAFESNMLKSNDLETKRRWVKTLYSWFLNVKIATKSIVPVSPVLKKGDILLWDSLTIYRGTLEYGEMDYPSLVCHYAVEGSMITCPITGRKERVHFTRLPMAARQSNWVLKEKTLETLEDFRYEI